MEIDDWKVENSTETWDENFFFSFFAAAAVAAVVLGMKEHINS